MKSALNKKLEKKEDSAIYIVTLIFEDKFDSMLNLLYKLLFLILNHILINYDKL